MGRDREYDDNATRQRAYRARKADELKRLREGKPAHRDRLRKRLVRVLGMLGSDNATERDAAARMATQILKDAGFTWYDLLDVTDERT
jgi:hypothetical protein